MLAFEDDEIIQKYRDSQDVQNRQMTDARNSENRETNFYEAISRKCNSEIYLPETEALTIHEDFEQSFFCPRSKFVWNPKNAKTFMQKIKH